MKLQELRERINVGLHPHRERVLSGFKAANVLVSLSAFACLIAYYGYLESETARNLIGIIKGSFAFYVLHYLVRWFFDFHPFNSSKIPA